MIAPRVASGEAVTALDHAPTDSVWVRRLRARSVRLFAGRHFSMAVLLAIFTIALNAAALSAPLVVIVYYAGAWPSDRVHQLVAILATALLAQVLCECIRFGRAKLLHRYADGCEARFADAARCRGGSHPAGRPSGLKPLKDLEEVRTVILGNGLAALLDLPFITLFLAALMLIHPGLVATSLGFVAAIATFGILAHILDSKLGVRRSATPGPSHLLSREAGIEQGLWSLGGLEASWLEHRRRLYSERRSARTWPDLLRAAARILKSTHVIVIMGIAAFLTWESPAHFGFTLASIILARRILEPLDTFVTSWPDIRAGFFAWRRLNTLRAPARPPIGSATGVSGRLRVEQVPIAAIRGVNAVPMEVAFEINPGELLGIAGPSGAGKTALAKTIAGLGWTGSGRITLGDLEISPHFDQGVAEFIGYLPQTVTFFAGSIADNVTRFAPQRDLERAVRVLEMSGAWDFISGLRARLGTDLGAAFIPRGIVQRISIARAIYHQPFLLVLDDPTAHMDGKGVSCLLDIIAEHANAGGIGVVATNDEKMLSRCQLILDLTASQPAASRTGAGGNWREARGHGENCRLEAESASDHARGRRAARA